MLSSVLRIHPSVRAALAAKQPVVALESTIITHGLPAPNNLQTALAIERAVRDQGAVPATTAFIDGKAYVGLESHQIERLAETGKRATKTSRRDVAGVLAAGSGSLGATTVSGTMLLAHLAGIRVFGTGGIGGVHRGGEASLDVSADLTELSRTPVAVFCSGAKSILDIPRTLEYLETMGVAVHTMNSSGQFPAFYSATSGCTAPYVGSPRDAARIILANTAMRLQSGMVFGVPIPAEFEEAGSVIQAHVEQAVRESVEQGIDKRGKEATPWLLARVAELTQGDSIVSNRALVINNVTMAAKVAKELQSLGAQEGQESGAAHHTMSRTFSAAGFEAIGEDREHRMGGTSRVDIGNFSVVVIGYAAVDITSRRHKTRQPSTDLATTWPGQIEVSLGGVGRNIAEGVHRLLWGDGVGVKLISPTGRDGLSHLLVEDLERLGMTTQGLLPGPGRTASVLLQLDEHGDLQTGVADIDDARPTREEVEEALGQNASSVVVMDGNVSLDAMTAVLSHRSAAALTIFEPTSVARSVKIVDAFSKSCGGTVDVITPNVYEVDAIYARAMDLELIHPQESSTEVVFEKYSESMNPTIDKAARLAELFQCTLLVKSGAQGVMVARYRRKTAAVHISHHAGKHIDSIVNTTGAGDTFAAAIVACLYAKVRSSTLSTEDALDDSDAWRSFVDVAQDAALLTLQSQQAISPQLHTLSERIVN